MTGASYHMYLASGEGTGLLLKITRGMQKDAGHPSEEKLTILWLRDSPVPVVEDEEVVACGRGGERGEVGLEDRGVLWRECEVERDLRAAAGGNRMNVLLTL